jgi:hypothetical protein
MWCKMIRNILKFIINCVVFSQMLMLEICFENTIWRISVIVFAYLFSFFNLVLKGKE